MAKVEEVLKYRADVSEAERDIGRLGETEKRTMEGAKKGTDAVGSATADLTKQKEKLGAVVRTLGGSFSGLIGDLGNVLELLLQAGPAGAAAAAGIAGFTAVVKLIQGMNEELERAIELTNKLKDAQAAFTEAQIEPAEQITASLKAIGAFSQANLRGAFGLFERTMAQGVAAPTAAGLAGAGFVAGLSGEDLSLLAAAGLTPATKEEAQRQIADLRANEQALAEVQRQAAEQKQSRAGAQALLQAAVIRQQMATDPRFFERVAGVSQDVILQEEAKKWGLLKPEAGLERVDELRQEYEDLLAKGREFSRKPAWTVTPWAASEALARAERARAIKPLVTYGIKLTAAGFPDVTGPITDAEAAAAAGGGPEPGGFTPGTRTVIQNITNIRVGTQIGVAKRSAIYSRNAPGALMADRGSE